MPKKAFTLIELLVVIAIIAILAAILFPVFAQAKDAAKKTTDISNFKQIGVATHLYMGDYDDRYPMSNTGGYPNCWGCGPPDTVPGIQMMPYVKNTSVHVNPKDPFTEEERIKDHASDMGWGTNPTAVQKLYALMVRSNIGMNYAFFSPWRYIPSGNPNTTSGSVSQSEVAQTSGALLYITSIWYRDSGGHPWGGGNWIVETPCWKDINGNFLRPMSQYAAGTGDGTLYQYPGGGWWPPTSTVGSNAWLVYGGTWPYWNQTSLSHIQPGLKDGHVVTLMADTSAKSRPIKRLTDGCTGYYTTGSYRGRVADHNQFLWDLD